MAPGFDLENLASSTPLLLYLASPFLLIALICSLTRLWTTFAYYRALQQFRQTAQHGHTSSRSNNNIVTSPQLPYSIPWLGNALSFLNMTPGGYWNQIFRWYPRSNGIMTILMAGRKTHIVYGLAPVQALFKAKTPNRDFFERDMFQKVFGMSADQIQNAAEGKHLETEMNARYMTNFDKVNELTGKFVEVLEEVLGKENEENEQKQKQQQPKHFYTWLRDKMFTASITALMGSHLLAMYPNWCEDFFAWDNDFLGFFFGIPPILQRTAHRRRERIYSNLETWSQEMLRRSGGQPVDPDGPAWEPLYGSRLNRARQMDYKIRGLNSSSGAKLDAGITFGLATNVIPATGWMLMQILHPAAAASNLLPRVLAEIQASRRPEDGSLDVIQLVSQPLLQSIWIEALRLYSDLLVVRTMPEDLILPLDEDGKTQVQLRKGDNVFAPSYIPHHDESWTEKVPWDVFDPERFIVTDPKTGTPTFVFSKPGGKFFPFGGGKTICPGRIFAKQEAIAAVAIVLSRFDFDVMGYVDENKQPCTQFPGIQRAYPGSGALAPGGDLVVNVRKRVW